MEIPRRRVFLALAAAVIFLGSIGVRLTYFQVLGANLEQEARDERFGDHVVPARRGTIYDRNGLVLASTIPADRLEVDLRQIAPEDDAVLARALSGPLGISADDILTGFRAARADNRTWVQVKRRLTPEQSAQVRALKAPCVRANASCIYLTPEPQRVYPNGELAAQTIGFANWDLAGAYGVELAYDDQIAGRPGRVRAEYDVAGNLIAIGEHELEPPVDGSDVVLTLDAAVQRIAEAQLAQTIRRQNAAGGTIIVMDVQTGAIVALASQPTFDPNSYARYDLGAFVNPALSDLYEPGSTMKVLTMAIGLETGAVKIDTIFHDAPGYLMVDRYRITNLDGATYGHETMSEILQHSSNLGAAYIAHQTGAERFYQKLRDFGIGSATGIDLPAELDGIVNWPDNPQWRPINLTTNAFGQGISVTPLQMLTAISACVNGGRLMRPYIVQELRHNGRVTRSNEPAVVRQVISPAVSRDLVGMMTDVADKASAPYFVAPGYAVGSKSGTAQIPAAGGGYEPDNQVITSLIGFGPSEAPRFAVLVKIDRPRQNNLGVVVAGPPAGQLLLDLFTLYALPPTRRTP